MVEELAYGLEVLDVSVVLRTVVVASGSEEKCNVAAPSSDGKILEWSSAGADWPVLAAKHKYAGKQMYSSPV